MKNTLPQSITGTLDLELPPGVTAEPAEPQFGPLAPGDTAQVPVHLLAAKDAAQGKRLVPYRVGYRTEAAEQTRTAAFLSTSWSIPSWNTSIAIRHAMSFV